MLRRAVTASLFLASFAAMLSAQDKPNFSGTWKLNVAKSDFGVLPGPDSELIIVDHKDPALKLDVNQEGQQGKQNFTLNYTTDGKEAVNKVGPSEIKSVAVYEGNTLVVNSKLDFNGQDVTIKGVWTLSADGKTLTQNSHLASAMGETDQKMIFEKQDGTPAIASATTDKTMPAATPSGPKPNFSGVWKLNVAKSDFGVMPAPEERTDTIDHADPVMKLARKEKSAEGAREFVMSFSTDGKEIVNNLGGLDAKVVSSWEGPALIANIKLNIQGQDIAIRQVSTLSPDGKVMTSKNHITSAMGEMDQVEVYEKQP